MLLLEATISFDTPSESPTALKNDLATQHILRRSINFGNDPFFSGEIHAQDQVFESCLALPVERLSDT